MRELEERLEKLQRANRRNCLLVTLVLLVAVVASWAGAAPGDKIPEVIRAHAFEVVDEQGRVRIALHNAGSGPQIGLVNRDGIGVVTIMGFRKFGAIATYDGQGGQLVRIGNTAIGSGAVIVSQGTTGHQLVTLMGNKNGGEVRVIAGGESGRPVCVLRCDENGDGLVGIFNHKFRGRILKPTE